MLTLEHINLVVNDINSTLDFYRAAMPHWRVRDQGEGKWNGKPRQWLHFGDDYQYIALADNGAGAIRDLEGHQPGLAHFAFVTNSIDAIISRLTTAGFYPSQQGGDSPHRRNIYYVDPAGFEVEFVEYLTDLPSQRNSTI